MTHEEVLTIHIAREVRSYRDLPKLLYHFQTKERDEPRPRAGMLRTREFIMKDSYSFDRDLDGLDASYGLHIEAYDRIFDRTGLEWYRVESDVGMMGGIGAHEYMAPCAAGENDVALSDSGYAANIEIASATAQPVDGLPGPSAEPREVETPGASTVDAVCEALGVPPGAIIKAFPVIVEGRGPVLVVIRGDHRLNEIKLQNTLGAPFRPAEAEQVRSEFGAEPGFIGPLGSPVEVLADEALRGLSGLVAGANKPDVHVTGVEPGRDFEPTWVDVRRVEEGDLCPAGSPIRIEPAIEVGNIFKLGTRYSDPLGARYLDEEGKEQLIWMGSYGIGPARIVAAAIEQFADEQGHLMAACRRALRRGAGDAREAGRGGAHALGPALRRAARARPRRALRRPRGEPGREVRRRRAARLPAAGDDRQEERGGRRDRGSGAPRPGEGLAAARGRRRGGCGAVADPPLRRKREPLTFRRLSGLDRSGGPATARPAGASRSTRGRSRTRSASYGWRSCRCSSSSG